MRRSFRGQRQKSCPSAQWTTAKSAPASRARLPRRFRRRSSLRCGVRSTSTASGTNMSDPAVARTPAAVEIFDTTLRDGSQREGVSLTVDDKLRIAEQLDHLGLHYIEGGWPGANPKDDEFFQRAPAELNLSTSPLVAFGSTRRIKGKVDDDPTLGHLVKANTSTVCIVGKCWDYHVTEALHVSLDEGVAMVRDSVEFLHLAGLRV